MIVAVYGTLRKGFRAHSLLSHLRDPVLIDQGFYEINYKMYDSGSYPCLIKDDQKNKIYLEVYDVEDETEKSLDYYEGYPVLFDKEEVELTINDESKNDKVKATIYIVKDVSKEGMKMLNEIKSGKYGS